MIENKPKRSIFFKWILNNKFTVFLLNILIILLIILLFTKVRFVFAPVGKFLNVVAPPIFLAAVFYYLMEPLVALLERKWHWKRMVSITILFILLVGLLALGISLLIPYIQKQTQSLVANWPQYWQAVQDWLKNISGQPSFRPIKDQLNASTDTITKSIGSWFQKNFVSTFSNIGSAVGTVTTIIVNVITAPFILFFMLKDGGKFKTGLVKLVPTRLRPSTQTTLTEINNSISSYIRGQLTVAFWVMVMFSVGYLIVGQKYAFPLGILAGILNLVPYVGSFLAILPSLVIAGFTSVSMLIKVLIVFLIEQTIEGRVISPLVMGSKLEMHPVTTILVLLTAGNLFGFLGVVLGIPGYAVIKIIIVKLWRWFTRNSELYDSKAAETQNDNRMNTSESSES
ncbi:AI-2E family transporter [Lactobacillus sp. CC-MHH1034]|uniref:AI-2E family transporter n=1 Tax=Agrilactobacillus fermenti TaxID=2586909 RepID=UPI001E41AAF8|nr:AI-2E family transporter [Agrilactobacillus fermenti]MCD2257275.1 AI-2E family transporter [Agrilactobacillus fermenti]